MRRPVSPEIGEFIEAFALESEQVGWPRIAGRILGWLLVVEDARQSPGDLVEALGVSKASVSSMTRFLLDRQFIERCAKPGDRRVYYRLAPGLWPGLLKARLGGVASFQALAERALDLVGTSPRSDRAREMATFYRWWAAEVPGLLQRWEAFQARQAGVAKAPAKRRGG